MDFDARVPDPVAQRRALTSDDMQAELRRVGEHTPASLVQSFGDRFANVLSVMRLEERGDAESMTRAREMSHRLGLDRELDNAAVMRAQNAAARERGMRILNGEITEEQARAMRDPSTSLTVEQATHRMELVRERMEELQTMPFSDDPVYLFGEPPGTQNAASYRFTIYVRSEERGGRRVATDACERILKKIDLCESVRAQAWRLDITPLTPDQLRRLPAGVVSTPTLYDRAKKTAYAGAETVALLEAVVRAELAEKERQLQIEFDERIQLIVRLQSELEMLIATVSASSGSTGGIVSVSTLDRGVSSILTKRGRQILRPLRTHKMEMEYDPSDILQRFGLATAIAPDVSDLDVARLARMRASRQTARDDEARPDNFDVRRVAGGRRLGEIDGVSVSGLRRR